MSELTIYHNPACSKSRETLALIRASGHEPRIVEYLSSVEATTSSYGAELLDVLPLLLTARNEVEKASAGDAAAFDQASQALAKARRLFGNLEGFPAIVNLIKEISEINTAIDTPAASSLDPNQDVKDKVNTITPRINGLIQRVRVLRRSQRLGSEAVA